MPTASSLFLFKPFTLILLFRVLVFVFSVCRPVAVASSIGCMRPPSFSIIMSPSYNISMPRRSARLQPARYLHTTAAATNQNDSQLKNNERSYYSMKVPELRQLLRERGLAISGTKSTLVERLSLSVQVATENAVSEVIVLPKSKRTKTEYQTGEETTQSASSTVALTSQCDCLPRTRELQLLSSHKISTNNKASNLVIIGVDEAGRGPLAGPVVAAAAIVPTNVHGIIDSKKITKEEERERIYEELIASPGIRYAVAVISAQRIDEINILQATLEGMRNAVSRLMNMDCGNSRQDDESESNVVSAERMDLSYVVTGRNDDHISNSDCYYALIDGNKVPTDMPCECESLVKGDGREYAIGAASILAKVTRDRLMHEYDKMYPMYNLSQHKGYPTEAHRSAVMKYGASPIHRRTFAPLKSMKFDDHGNVIR